MECHIENEMVLSDASSHCPVPSTTNTETGPSDFSLMKVAERCEGASSFQSLSTAATKVAIRTVIFENPASDSTLGESLNSLENLL
jgi:hypothetical protein